MYQLPEKDKHLLPKSATKQEWELLLIDLMLDCYTKNNGITYNVFRDYDPGRNLSRSVERVFGSWNNGLQAAGIKENRTYTFSDQYLIDQLKSFYNEYGFVSYDFFDADKNYVCPTTIERRFGSWNEALDLARIPRNRSGIFSDKHNANDGHLCDSLGEKIVDDWLYAHNVRHVVHYPYPVHPVYNNGRPGKNADFYTIDYNVYIEFAGLLFSTHKITEKYERKLVAKKSLASVLGLDLIVVLIRDLKNLDNELKRFIAGRSVDTP